MCDISILYEDERLIAIHKPEGIPFHNELADVKGVVSQVREVFSSLDLYPVHRLDRVTSGVMLFAKGKQANSLLSRQFENRSLEKYYLAVSDVKPKKKQGSVIGDMEKGRNGSYLLKRSHDKPAVTRFKSFSLQNLSPFKPDVSQAKWLHVVKIETGKTHQVRVALKSLGSPILGDQRYGGGSLDRAYLHAYCVRFKIDEKLYEIYDKAFNGEYFQLSDVNNEKILEPKVLEWPKASYIVRN